MNKIFMLLLSLALFPTLHARQQTQETYLERLQDSWEKMKEYLGEKTEIAKEKVKRAVRKVKEHALSIEERERVRLQDMLNDLRADNIVLLNPRDWRNELGSEWNRLEAEKKRLQSFGQSDENRAKKLEEIRWKQAGLEAQKQRVGMTEAEIDRIENVVDRAWNEIKERISQLDRVITKKMGYSMDRPQ